MLKSDSAFKLRHIWWRVLLFFCLFSSALYFSVVVSDLTPIWFANVFGTCLVLSYAFKGWRWPVLSLISAGVWTLLFSRSQVAFVDAAISILFFLIPYLASIMFLVLKEKNRALRYLSTHDILTRLLNRGQFQKILSRTEIKVDRVNGSYVLGYLDIDNLKMINEAAGYQAGDSLLKKIAMLLKKTMKRDYKIARLGSDEFAILGVGVPLPVYKKSARRLIRSIHTLRFIWNKRVYRISARLGSTFVSKTQKRCCESLNLAELACHQAKNGVNQVFISNMNPQAHSRNHEAAFLVNAIHEAVEKNRFLIYVQKIEPTQQNDKTEQYEVLLRMLDENDQLVQAGEIIPIAERFNLITQIDRWVISQLLKQYDKTINTVVKAHFSINISAISLSNPDFLSFLLMTIRKSSLPPNRLCFEITETAAMTNLTKTIHFVNEISKLGCKISLDDFGMGLSSFAYLQKFKVDYLKIDGHFVSQMNENNTDRVIVNTINEMAHQLNIQTVAECVENQHTLEEIKAMGVDYVQGFAIDRPKPLQQILFYEDKKVS